MEKKKMITCNKNRSNAKKKKKCRAHREGSLKNENVKFNSHLSIFQIKDNVIRVVKHNFIISG